MDVSKAEEEENTRTGAKGRTGSRTDTEDNREHQDQGRATAEDQYGVRKLQG